MKKSYNILIFKLISTFLLFNVPYLKLFNTNPLILFSFIPSLIIYLLYIYFSKKFFGIQIIFFLFSFLFFYLAPFYQITYNNFPWFTSQIITTELILVTNFFIFLFNFLWFRLINKEARIILKINPVFKNNFHYMFYTLFIFSIIAFVFILYLVGIENLFLRSTNNIEFINLAYSLIVDKSLRAFPFFLLLVQIIYYLINNKIYSIPIFCLSILMFFLLHFPTGLPRYQIASSYMALLVFPIIYKKISPYLFMNLFLLVYISMFAFLGNIRYVVDEGFSFQILYESLDYTLDFFTANYDAYTMLSRTIYFVLNEGYDFGSQLIGTIFFFIPRVFWPSKPIGSGHLIANYFNWSFTNVSSPFPAEILINFGFTLYFPILFISFIFLNKIFNSTYYFEKHYINIKFLIFSLFFGFLFFILRGDLLSSFAYFAGYSIPILITQAILLFLRRFYSNV